MPRRVFCDFDDARQVQRAGAHEHRDDDEADRDLVGDHLGRRAQRAEERVFRVRRPAAHDDAVDAERRDREDVEDAHIDVGDGPSGIERDDRPCGKRQHAEQQRGQQEHALVGRRRDHRLLQDELQEVREGLQQPPGTDHVRATAKLHRRPDLAIGQQRIGDEDQQGDQQQQALADHDRKAEENISEFHVPILLLGRFEPDMAGERGALGHDLRRTGDRVREVEILHGADESLVSGLPPMAASALTPAATSLVAMLSSAAKCGCSA